MMKFDKMLFAALSLAAGVPAAGGAQPPHAQGPRAENVRATADLNARIAAADARVDATRRRGAVTPARATQLRRQLAGARQEIVRLSRRQGFVSAGELGSYNRMLAAVDAELGRTAGPQPYGNDMLPSAEMTAFQLVDARLHYRNARIDHDGKGCAVYQGIARDGRTRRESLRDPAGRPICVRP